MGIELPTPSTNGTITGGEARVAPLGSAEQQGALYGGENYAAQQSTEKGQYAEKNTSERPAAQEVRNGQGAGDGFTANPQSGVAVTTDSTVTGTDPQAVPSLDDVPVVAADEDLIEKQWVDSTKKILKDTRSDPYRQSEAISRLQADYLQKRYGKTLADGGA